MLDAGKRQGDDSPEVGGAGVATLAGPADVPLDLAVVGCGRVMERYHVPALKRSSEWNVVAACDPMRERREWMRGQLAQVPVFDSFTALTEGCRPDAVLVATPPKTHADLVVRALDMGLHVLVEKPMALTFADADRMWQASLQAGKCLAVGFSRRFKGNYLDLRERLALLQPTRVQSVRFALFGNTETWKAVTDFLGDDRSGGGALDDMASHQLDLLPWLLNEPVRRVRAKRHTGAGEWSERIVYELQFDSGLTASCSVGHAAKKAEALQVQLADRQLVAYGDRLFELRSRPAAWTSAYCKLRILCDRAMGQARAGEDGIVPFVRQLRSFAAAARNLEGRWFLADAGSGVSTVRAIEACRRSVRSGGTWVSV